MEQIIKPEFKLIGLKLKGKTWNDGGQSAIDCGNLWQKFEKEKISEQIPGKMGNEVYSVYFEYEGDHTKPYSYFIGCRVSMGTEKPANLDELTIPAGKYTKLMAKGIMPDCVADVWRNIWNSKIERSYTYDYEVYDERSSDWNNAEADIFIAIH